MALAINLHIYKLNTANIERKKVQSLTIYKRVLDIGKQKKNGTLPYCPLVLQNHFYSDIQLSQCALKCKCKSM